MPNLFEDLIPTKSQPDNLFGDLIPAGQPVKRVPTAMDRGIDLSPDASVAEPQRDLGFWQKSGERLTLGLEQGALDQEAYKIMTGGGGGIEDYLTRRKDYQRRASSADIQGDNWFSQGWYGFMSMVGPMEKGMEEGTAYGTAAAGTAAIAGQLGPQAAIPEEIATVPGAFAVGTAVGSSQYWMRQGAGSLYADLREEGVPHDVASPVAQSFGVPYALIEYSQVAKAVPGAKRMLKQKIATEVKSALKRNAIRFGADVAAEVGEEVAQEVTLAAGKAVAEVASGVGVEGTSIGDYVNTAVETAKAVPYMMLPGRTITTVSDVQREKRTKELNDFLAKGNTELYRDRYTDTDVKKLIAGNEELKGLQGHDGRVVMFERVPEFKEGETRQSTVEYIKSDTNADLTTLIEQHETANPDSYYRGTFDLGTVEVAAKPDSIETRIETEVEVLGDGVLDPVRLGKHRIKAKDVQSLMGGEVTDTEAGYSVKLDSGIELEVDFTKAPEDIDVESYLSETGMERSAWEALKSEEQEERLSQAQVVGAFTKNSVIDEKGNRVEIPDSYLMMFGYGADIGTFRHEAVHFLRETNLLTEKEYQTLVSKYSRPDRDEARQEEDVARAYEHFIRRGGEDGIFKQIYDKFFGLLNVRSAAAILRRVDRGEIGRREKPVIEEPEAEVTEVVEEAEVTDEVAIEPPAVKESVRNLETRKFREDESLDIEGTGSRGQVTIDDVGKALETYSRETTDEVFTLDTDPERLMAQAVLNATDEATYQLQQPDSGVDWYEKDMRFTEKSLKLAYSELKNKAKMVLFKALMAPTSFGNNPVTNLGAASRIYEMGKGDFTNMPGRQPEGKGWTMRANATDLMIGRLNRLVKEKGEKGAADWLLSKHPIKEIREYHSGVSGKMDDLRFGAYIFGPKGGPFFLNLNGVSQELTKDMWFTRAWNRVMGTVLDEKGEIVESPRNDAERAVMDNMIEQVAADIGLTVSEFQAVWWYYEQQLWKSLGASVESYSFQQGAERILKQKGLQPPRVAKGRSQAAKRRQAAVDAAISGGARKGQGEPVIPPRQSVRVSPKTRERIHAIDGYESIEAEEDVDVANTTTINAILKSTFGRKSRQIVYFGGQATLRAKQKLELDEAYAARAVRKSVEELHTKLVNDAWDSQTGQKLPKWFRAGKWAKRLKKFYKLALPIAAHLNATGRNKDGTFSYGDFEMRAGLMPLKEFKKQGHEVGDTILVKNEVTGEMDPLRIGPHIVANGRPGHQLIRSVTAEQQGEIYDHYAEEFPDMIWAVDQFIDPSFKDARTVINGVEVPQFNRFSLESLMVEGDEDFQGVAGYTPDVVVSRSLMGALKGVFNPKAGMRSPGRKYKTGTGREGELKTETEKDEKTDKEVFAGYARKGGDLNGLFEGFSIRAYQAIREKARKEYFENIIRHAAKPIKDGKLEPGHVRLSTGIDVVWDAIKAFRNFETPDGDTEIERRLSEKGEIGDYSKFIGEAMAMRGKQQQIPERLVKLLQDGYAAEKVHHWAIRAGAWAIRNSTQTLLAHPFTYVINVLSNDVFAAESAAKHTVSGLFKLASSKGKHGADDLRFAKNLFTAQFYKFAAIRKMVGWKTDFDRFTEEIMPDDVFEGSTALEDLKVQYHVKPWEYLRQGEIGAAALQAIQYGSIDVRAKQRSAYAFLKSKAVRAAKGRGLTGAALKAEVDSYMARPPKEDRVQALELGNFDYLNYSDSPNVLNSFASNDYSRLLMPFPRFGYHYAAKQIQRLSALKVFIGKVPKGKRADALADLVTLGLFTAGGAGWVLDKVLRGDEDDEEARERIGTATYKYVDPETGEMTSKRLPRELITANRVNLSEYARMLGIDDDDDSDFWWRARQFPPIVMGGALVMAEQDGKKAGFSAGVKTYGSQAADLAKDFFTLGGGIKVAEKLYDTMTTEPGDRPPTMITDPYSSNVPLPFYIADQAMTALVPGRRQFDEVMVFIDPTSRRKTRSKTLGYEPGAWDAIKLGHASGVVNRILNKAGLTELPMAQGTVKEVAKRPVSGEKRERKALRREARGIIAEGRPEAREFRDRHGNLRLGLIPEATRTYQPREMQALKLGGFNIRRYPRANYEEALQPPQSAR